MKEHYDQGYLFQFMIKETVRNLIFFKRERVILTFIKHGAEQNHGGK